MTTVTISPKFQIVIPKDVREELDITVGMHVEVISYDNRIEIIPMEPIKNLRGSLKGIDTSITRDKDRI